MAEHRNIPFGRPMLGATEKRLAAEVLEGTILTHGPHCVEFEKRFAERVGARHAVTVSSCTTGLQLCLMTIGVESGDEVIVPAETHVATAHVVEHLGARPIFVDADRITGNINPAKIEDAISAGTRAIIVVHYLGLPCDMDQVCAIAERRGIPIIEDCALAVGADYGGRCPGTIGLAGAFSFYPAKHITTLEGGMVTTNDDKVAGRLRSLRAFGYDRTLSERKIPGIYDVVALGHNFRMSEVHAAVGLGQLDQLNDFLAARHRNTQILREGLADLKGFMTFPIKCGKASSACYCVNIVATEPDLDRGTMIERLNAAGVGTSVHYPIAVPLARYYREKYGHRPGDFPVAEWISSNAISLPVGPHVSSDDAQYIVDVVRKVTKEAIAA